MKRTIFKAWVYMLPALFFGYVIYCGVYYNTEETVTVKVTDKERVNNNDNSYYLVFTNSETFKCTDEMLIGKFNSSDFYGRIHKDSTYKFRVIGWRLPFFSMYRNIIKIK